MARQHLGAKKTQALARQLSLPIVRVLVRGGTEHRQDLCLENGSIIYYWPKTGEMYAAENLTHQFTKDTPR